jgi:hypothetical protein
MVEQEQQQFPQDHQAKEFSIYYFKKAPHGSPGSAFKLSDLGQNTLTALTEY